MPLRVDRRGRLVTPELGPHGVQRAVRDLLEAHGWLVYTTHELDARKSSGRRGQPDLIALRYAREPVLCIECKRLGGKAELHQAQMLIELGLRGFSTFVVDDVKAFALELERLGLA